MRNRQEMLGGYFFLTQYVCYVLKPNCTSTRGYRTCCFCYCFQSFILIKYYIKNWFSLLQEKHAIAIIILGLGYFRK